jgi:hypothetical protein
MKTLSLRAFAMLIGIACTTGCGATEPSPVPALPPATGVYAADLDQVTEGIVQEFRNIGLTVDMAERISAGIFTVGARRIDIPIKPDPGSIYIHVYPTPELAWGEASRLGPDGNLHPEPGQPPRSHATWANRVHFHYRDRVIAMFGGCHAEAQAAMVRVFGPALVVANGVIRCDLPLVPTR